MYLVEKAPDTSLIQELKSGGERSGDCAGFWSTWSLTYQQTHNEGIPRPVSSKLGWLKSRLP